MCVFPIKHTIVKITPLFKLCNMMEMNIKRKDETHTYGCPFKTKNKQ